MSWRPWLEPAVLAQMGGLPPEAFDVLLRTLARVCEDPRDRLHSKPLGDDSRGRMAELEDSGFIEFTIDEKAGLIRVRYLIWTG